MAHVTIHEEKRHIEDPKEINEFLNQYGITYQHWGVEGRIDPDASNEEVLEEYAEEVEVLKQQGGYVTADVIACAAGMENLDAMLAKFSKEHTHSEDEVRFIIKGRGIFHINPGNGPVFAIQVESGDLINVPKGTRHWFDLCKEKNIRAIRLFQDMTGWTPEYLDDGVHEEYAPVCWGPDYLQQSDEIKPIINP